MNRNIPRNGGNNGLADIDFQIALKNMFKNLKENVNLIKKTEIIKITKWNLYSEK